jgi:hypothetical protein
MQNGGASGVITATIRATNAYPGTVLLTKTLLADAGSLDGTPTWYEVTFSLAETVKIDGDVRVCIEHNAFGNPVDASCSNSNQKSAEFMSFTDTTVLPTPQWNDDAAKDLCYKISFYGSYGQSGWSGWSSLSGWSGWSGPQGANIFSGPDEPPAFEEGDLWWDTDGTGGDAVLLSTVGIDANKNWSGYSITNLGAVSGSGNSTFAQVISTTRPSISAICIASNNDQYTNGVYVEMSGAADQLMKSFTISVSIASCKIRLQFSASGGNTATMTVYKNGVATTLVATATVGTPYSGFVGTLYDLIPGDVIGLYGKNTGSMWIICPNGTSCAMCFDVTTVSAEYTTTP